MKCPQCGYQHMDPAMAKHSCYAVKRKNHLAEKSGMLKKPRTGAQIVARLVDKLTAKRKN